MLSGITSLATTGIGSLPELTTAQALDWAFSLDIPYLPTLPRRDVGEGIFGQALRGLPGLHMGPEGSMNFEEDTWLGGIHEFSKILEESILRREFARWVPRSPSSLWPQFLKRCHAEDPPWVKLQLVGPVTLAISLAATRDISKEIQSKLYHSATELVLARAIAMVQALKQGGREVLFFWDEPSLGCLNLEDPWQMRAWERLKKMIAELGGEGAEVGLHCCGAVELSRLLGLPLKVLSFDTSLSLASLMGASSKIRTWRSQGGRLALGLIPTKIPRGWDLEKSARAIREAFKNAFGVEGEEMLRKSLLTPACGLGLRTQEEASEVMAQLKKVKRRLLEI